MRMAEEMRPGCTVMMKHIIGTVASKHIPSVWAALPQHVQDEVVAKAVEDTPGFVAAFASTVFFNPWHVLNDLFVGIPVVVRL